MAVRQWRGRSFAIAAALSGVNRRNLLLTVGAHAAIMAVLCLVIGAKLIGDGISGLG